MALKLEEIQPILATVVKGIDPFKSYQLPEGDTLDNHIFQDDGTKRDDIEASLKQFGWAVVVSLPLGVSVSSQQCAGATSPANHGDAKINIVAIVTLKTNPKLNTGPITDYPTRPPQVPVFTTIRSIIKAVLSWLPSKGEKGFELILEHPFSPDLEDIGCMTYDIRFSKTVVI
jgi:hypothetical protein